MQRGRYSLLKQIHLDGSHAVSFQEGCGLAAERHASECKQQEIDFTELRKDIFEEI